MKKMLFDELTKDYQSLVKAAASASKNAYVPYSKYPVGAAVLSSKGNIYIGCNIERATLSQTTHAERCAVDSMASTGERKIKALCCFASNGGIPCAECRQAIWEFCDNDPNVVIIGADSQNLITITSIGEIYPYSFGPKDLGINPNDY